MASDERKKAGDLSRFEAFKDHPEKYHIFQALRLIEAQYADKPRLGRSRRPSQDAVRLKQRIDMAFASSTVTRFVPQDEKSGTPGEMSQHMFGLFGPNGPLPLHLTEYAYNRQRSFRDPTFKAFGDIFHHRMMSLFYRAYASGEPTSSFDRAGEIDPFAQKVAAFAGMRGAAFAERDAMPDLAKLRYSGRLAHGTRNEEGLLALISGFFGAPATMESFVGTWLELDPKDTWELGNPAKPAKLGKSCSIGSKVWTRQAKFRFRVGPVGLKEYKRLLPGGDSLKRLKSLVNNYMGEALMWDMNLVLKAGHAEPAMLARAVEDEEVSVVVSHEEDIVTTVERAEEMPFSPVLEVGTDAGDPFGQSAENNIVSDAEAGGHADEADPLAPESAPILAEGATPPGQDQAEPALFQADSTAIPALDEAPLDMEKTVVIPVMAAPATAATVKEDIDFGATVGHFGEETPQIPPLSAGKGHKDDSQPQSMGVYLGWTAWLGRPPGDKDLDQLFIQSDA